MTMMVPYCVLVLLLLFFPALLFLFINELLTHLWYLRNVSTAAPVRAQQHHQGNYLFPLVLFLSNILLGIDGGFASVRHMYIMTDQQPPYVLFAKYFWQKTSRKHERLVRVIYWAKGRRGVHDRKWRQTTSDWLLLWKTVYFLMEKNEMIPNGRRKHIFLSDWQRLDPKNKNKYRKKKKNTTQWLESYRDLGLTRLDLSRHRQQTTAAINTDKKYRKRTNKIRPRTASHCVHNLVLCLSQKRERASEREGAGRQISITASTIGKTLSTTRNIFARPARHPRLVHLLPKIIQALHTCIWNKPGESYRVLVQDRHLFHIPRSTAVARYSTHGIPRKVTNNQ